ncbi:MAG: extensin family protein [Gammaproteobacteria bacterium]
MPKIDFLSVGRALFVPPLLIIRGLGWLLRSARNRKRFAIGLVCALVAGVGIAELTLEHRHLPWRPLAIDDQVGIATGFKLRLIDWAPASWCRDLLGTSAQLEVRRLDPLDGQGSCGWSDAFHIEKSGVRDLNGTSHYAMQCTLAAGAHLWITSADAHARRLLGSGLVRIHHYGTYSCRRMYNRKRGKMSEHAFANAWDVSGFELEDGRIISVLKDWQPRGTRRSFLRAVHRDACRAFNVVLGPNYNDAHRDHFHVDMSNGASCR